LLLRAWALAAVCGLLADPLFRHHAADAVRPALVATLLACADAGDLPAPADVGPQLPPQRQGGAEPQTSPGKRASSAFPRGGASLSEESASAYHSGPASAQSVASLGNASAASAAAVDAPRLAWAAQELGRQRLAALCCAGLLQLAYHHAPSLQALRLAQPNSARGPPPGQRGGRENWNFSDPAWSIEAPLLRVLLRPQSCCRLKRSAAHLLLLLVSEDADAELSYGDSPADSYGGSQGGGSGGHAGAARTVLAAAHASALGDWQRAAERENKLLAGLSPAARDAAQEDESKPTPPPGPLLRLNRAATGPSAASDGLSLEHLFLHLLKEQMPTDAGDDDEDGRASRARGGEKDAERWWGATDAEPGSPGTTVGGGRSAGGPVEGPGAYAAGAQAEAFGFLASGDGGERERERDALRVLCLHALVDLAARRDKAKVAIVHGGGARLASCLLRETPRAFEASRCREAAAPAHPSGSDDLAAGWSRTLPLHLLLNCSAADRARPKLCDATLDDLLRATTVRLCRAETHARAFQQFLF
jgi:hypothetical protein